MKWVGDSEEVIVVISRPSSWRVGGGNAGGGGAVPIEVMGLEIVAVEGAGDIGGSSL